MRNLLGVVLLFASGVSSQLGAAWADHYKIDPSHTRILFSISHMGYSNLPGMFRDFDVDLGFDPEKPAMSSLNVTVRTGSIDMFDGPLNDHLLSADFFNSEKFPAMTFVSRKLELIDDNHARISGDLTLLGVTLPIGFAVTLNQLKPNPMNNRMRVGFAAEGTIDRTAFGMNYIAPLVGTEVHFTLTAEADLVTD